MLRSPGRIASAALYAAAHSAVELAGTLPLAPRRPFGLDLGPQPAEDQCEHASEKRLRCGLFGNRFHARTMKAAPSKHPRSRIKQLLAGLCSRLTAGALPWGHGRG